jgi:hypothetical protein
MAPAGVSSPSGLIAVSGSHPAAVGTKQKFDELGVAIVLVAFQSSQAAILYSNDLSADWPILIDERRYLYNYLQMKRASYRDLWGRVTWKGYWQQPLKGELPRRLIGDIHQQGGDLLIDRGGEIKCATLALILPITSRWIRSSISL